jgi:hypothetical protein
MGFVTAMAIGGMAASTIGSMKSASGSRQAAKQAKQIAEYNARVMEQNAIATEMKAKFDQIRQARQGQRIKGKLLARAGASGAMTSEGAPLVAMADQATELALESALIGYEGMTEAQRNRQSATVTRLGGSMEATRYKNEASAAMWRGASSLLNGFGNMYSAGMFGGGGG